MTPNIEKSLVIQRENLRQELQKQRKIIAQQLSPGIKDNSGYPRSSTMRFLTNRPKLASGLVTELVILLTGARLFRLLSALMAFVKILRSTIITAQKQLPSPKPPNSKCDSV